MRARRACVLYASFVAGLLLAVGLAGSPPSLAADGPPRVAVAAQPYRVPSGLAGSLPRRAAQARDSYPGLAPAPVGPLRMAATQAGAGWQKIMAEDFEQPLAGRGWLGSDRSSDDQGLYYWDRRICKPHAGSYSAWAAGYRLDGASLACGATYPNNLLTFFRYGPVDLSQADDAELVFGLWADIEGNGPQLIDSVHWQASSDGFDFAGFATAGQTGDWVPQELDLSDVPYFGDLTGQPEVYLGWDFRSDLSNPLPYRGAFIDDVALWTYTAPPAEPAPAPVVYPVTHHTTRADFAAGYSYDGAVVASEQSDGGLALAPRAGGSGAWERLPSLPREIMNFQALVAQDHLFIIGGNSPDGFQRSVYSARVGEDGVLGAWREVTPLPQALLGHTAVVANNYLFVLGGYNANGIQSTVFSAAIKGDGTLGAWASLPALPRPALNLAVFAAQGYIYVLGGKTADDPLTVSDAVYRAALGPNGTLGAWETLPNQLPEPSQWQAVAAACGRVYLIGGADTAYERNTVYQAELRPDGSLGPWSESSHLPKTLITHTAAAVRGGILVVGGWHTGGTPIDSQRAVYWAPFGAGCGLGAWIEQPPLQFGPAYGALAATDRYVYSLGGINGVNRVFASVQVAPLLDAGGAVREGHFDHQFSLGKNYAIKSLQWAAEGGDTGRIGVRYRVASDSGAFGPWSDYTSANLVAVNAYGATLEYEIMFEGGSGADAPRIGEVSLTIAPNTAPSLDALPGLRVPAHACNGRALDLWSFAGDTEFDDSVLAFAIDTQPLASTGITLTIAEGRYLAACAAGPAGGHGEATLRVTDPGGLSATGAVVLDVVEADQRVYLPVIVR